MPWLINGLSKYRTYLFVGLAGLVALGGAYGAGYLVGGRNEARVQTVEVTKTVKEIQYVQVRNIEYERELQKDLEAARVLSKSLRSRLDQLPINNCPVSPDAVGVLNEAINPEANPPSVPAGEGTTVTQLTDWSFSAIQQYNETALRYNKLIDWVDENLVQPSK